MDQVASLHQSHCLQRYVLELDLDNMPRESRYSQSLVELMKREELTIRNGNSMKDVFEKVDEMLRHETRHFFRSVAQQNIKKWVALLQRFDKDRAKCKGLDHPVKQKPARQTPLVLTAKDLDKEEMRLEEEYNENWMAHEGFSLREAFRSQLARLENEWSTHEIALEQDYKAKCIQLTGDADYFNSTTTAMNTTQPQSSDTSRWQHPEKQKTLIHTAPVMSPVSTSGGLLAKGSGSQKMSAMNKRNSKYDSSTMAELNRVENQYQVGLSSLRLQKLSAVRWMNRQEVRLMAQAEEVQLERQAIAALMRREAADFNSVLY